VQAFRICSFCPKSALFVLYKRYVSFIMSGYSDLTVSKNTDKIFHYPYIVQERRKLSNSRKIYALQFIIFNYKCLWALTPYIRVSRQGTNVFSPSSSLHSAINEKSRNTKNLTLDTPQRFCPAGLLPQFLPCLLSSCSVQLVFVSFLL
jgi:hypothetical protein